MKTNKDITWMIWFSKINYSLVLASIFLLPFTFSNQTKKLHRCSAIDMSQPREHYVRKCNESTSITADKAVGSRVKTEAITMETPPIEQPLGVQVQSEDEDEFWPLSGKPHFDIVIRKSHISGMYQMLMPSRMQKELPCATVPVVVTYRGKKWEMVYTSYQGSRRLQRAGWKEFAVDNHLKIGDACVFELVECSSDRIEFKVQILRGDFPAELLEQIEGSTRENPLIVP